MNKKMIIVAGPSAVGKSTFVSQAILELPQLEDTKTFTTRKMREGEVEGDPYHHVSEERFQKLLEDGYFVEWAKVHDNHYGTPNHQLHEAWDRGKTIIMDVDIQGAKTFKEKFPQALSLFIHPPSFDVLRQRLEARDGKGARDLELRLRNASFEITQSKDFDVEITNDNFETSYKEFKKIIVEFLEKK